MARRLVALAMTSGLVVALVFTITTNAQSKPRIPERAAKGPSRGLDLSAVVDLSVAKRGVGQRDVAAARSNYEAATETGRYIVILKEPAVPSYEGSLPGFPATTLEAQMSRRASSGAQAASGRPKLDPKDVSVVAYRGYLVGRQDILINQFRNQYGSLEVDYRYQFAANGFSARMDRDTAAAIAKDPAVRFVEPVRELPMDTTTTPGFIGAEAVFNGEVDGVPYKGEGMVVGIFDSGINHFHPSFAATGDDGYTVQAPPELTGGYLGECATRPELCNDKLIGAYVFDGSADADIVEEEFDNPASADIDGHGSHVAATAAGNVVFDVAPFDPLRQASSFSFAEVSGVAPHANIISYKVCHVRSCPTADILAAMNQAIADGVVDVVNKSISSASGSPWADALSLAYLEARGAGIFVANSAGNDGPDAGTAGRINSSPWVAGVAATTHPRGFEPKELSGLTGGDTAPPIGIVGRGVSAAYTAPIVFAGDFTNGVDDEPEQCLVPFPPGTFSGEIVVCDRGAIARVDKGVNVLAGGAGGLILANLQGGASSLNDDIHALPAIHISADDGDALKAWLASGTGHAGSIGAAVGPINDLALADTVIDFSSAGPYEGFDILAPNIAAPGVDILAAGAGLRDEVLDFILANYPAAPAVDTPYGIISGTSMASPHVAGAAALLKQARPLWTDAEVLSALQTTATRALTRDGGVATPLDIGAGRIQIDRALQAGLVLDETVQNFEDANPDAAPAGDPRTLNVVGLVDRQCVETCTWTRTVRAVTADTWDLSTNQAWLTVSPSEISLNAGETATLTVTADVTGLPPLAWQAAEVLMMPRTVTSPDQHLTISVRPSAGTLPESVELVASRNQGSRRVRNVTSVTIDSFSSTVYGPFPRVATEQSAAGDSDNSSPYDDTTDGVVESFFTVPAGALRVVFETFDSESPDIDLFVGIDFNGNGAADEFEEVCFSATATNAEVCDIALGGVNPELSFWVLVQNWEASAEPPDTWQLGVAIVEATEGATVAVTGPSGTVNALEPYDLDYEWNLAAAPGEVYYGVVEYFSDSAKTALLGVSDLSFFRETNDSSIAVSPDPASAGDIVTVEIEVGRNFNEFDRNVTVTHDIPAGLTLVGGSVNQGGVVSGSTITWNLVQPGLFDPDLQGAYSVTTSNDSPDCTTPFGITGYVNFSAASFSDITPFSFTGTDQIFALGGFPSTYYNGERDAIVFTSEGFFGVSPGATVLDGTPAAFPNSAAPNDLVAALWNDWSVVTDATTDPENKRGVYGALYAGGALIASQWAEVELGAERASMETFYWTFVDDSPGAYEIITTIGPVTAGATGFAGLENADGTLGTNYTGGLVENTVICYDFVGPSAVTLTYQATVDGDASGTLTLESTDSDDVPNTIAVTRSTTLTVENDPGVLVFNPATYEVNEDATVDVTVERVGGEDGPVTVDVVSTGGTATAGTDYTAVSQSLSWADGERGAKTVTVTTLADSDSEGTETIALEFENLTGATAGESSTAVVAIADAQDPGAFSFSAAVASVSEDGTEVVLTVNRVGGTAQTVTVDYSTADGTATVGEDYTATSGTLTFNDGDGTAQTITVPILDDGAFEGDETFRVTLANPSGAPLGDITEVEVTITEDDDPAAIGFASASETVGESAGSITLSVSRTDNSTGEVTVNFATADGTAVAGEDYTTASGTLTWGDGVTTAQTITIDILDDAIGELDETFVVELSEVSSNGTLTNSTATVTITDDDTKVQFVTASATVAEDGGSVTLDVERTGTGGDTSVDYRFVSITASPADFVNVNGTVSWSDGDGANKQITVDIIDDALVEGDQEFLVELVNPINASLGSPTSASVVITDNDSSVEFVATSAQVAEDGASVVLEVSRVGSSVGAVAVDYETADGSAEAGSDYTAASGTLTWADGDLAPKPVSIDITDDALLESPENFSVLLSNAVGAALGDSTQAVVTIVDNDTTTDTVAFAATTVEVNETAGTVDLTVSRTSGTGPLTIAYTTDDGSALAGEDYTPVSGSVEWLDTEVDDRTITVPLIDNEQGEGPEDFFVFIPGTGAGSTARVTVVDDTFEVSFAAASLDVNAAEDVGTVSFTVEASGDGDGGSVDYAIVPDTADSTDVANATGTLTFTGGDLSAQTITIDIVDDAVLEGEESLSLVLTNPTGEASISASAGAATLTITDNESAGVIELASDSAMVSEADGTVTLTVNRVGGVDGAVSVDFATANDTAVAGEDYTETTGTLSWADQDGTAQTITVPVTDDTTPEMMETFTVTLSNPTGLGAALGTTVTATVTIVSDDGGLAVIQFSDSEQSASETDGSVELSVVRDGNTAGEVTVDYATADGTAVAGEDYTATSGTLTWADGVGGAQTITVPLTDDGVTDAGETFTVSLSNVTGDAIIDVIPTTTVTITEDDPSGGGGVIDGAPTVFASSGAIADENDGTVTVSLALDGPSPGMTMVSWTTADGTARAGSDYTAASGSVSWSDGDSSEKTFTLDILDDSAVEGPETFQVVLTSTDLNVRSPVTVLIDDDDRPASGGGGGGGDDGGDDEDDGGGCAATPVEPFAMLGLLGLLGRLRRRRR